MGCGGASFGIVAGRRGEDGDQEGVTVACGVASTT